MTRHENILSFDEARSRDPRSSRRTSAPAGQARPATYPNVPSSQQPRYGQAASSRPAYPQAVGRPQQVSPWAEVRSQQAQQAFRHATPRMQQPQRLTYDPSFERSFTATPRSGSVGSSYRPQRSGQMPRVQSSGATHASPSASRSGQFVRASHASRLDHTRAEQVSRAHAQAHGAARPEPSLEDAHQAEAGKNEKKSLSHRLRAAKAERQFNKTFGSDEPVKPGPEQSSRPALYEMKMGKSHKRSARMQNIGSSKKRAGILSRIAALFAVLDPRSPRFSSRALITCATFVLAVVMLYQPVANYYQEVRQQQQLEAEYAVVADYYSNLKSEVEYLNTKEGLEEYVREELGWVKGGERVATVEGLDPRDATVKQGSITADLSNAVPTPVTWYSPVLDVLLGYNKP